MIKKKREVLIIDYGMGNIYSLYNALKYLGAKVIISDDPSKISKSKILMLPGVGSFKKAMHQIRKKKKLMRQFIWLMKMVILSLEFV